MYRDSSSVKVTDSGVTQYQSLRLAVPDVRPVQPELREHKAAQPLPRWDLQDCDLKTETPEPCQELHKTSFKACYTFQYHIDEGRLVRHEQHTHTIRLNLEDVAMHPSCPNMLFLIRILVKTIPTQGCKDI